MLSHFSLASVKILFQEFDYNVSYPICNLWCFLDLYICVVKFGKFSVIFSNYLSVLFSFSFGTLIMCMLVCLILSHGPLELVCFFLLSLSIISVLALSLLFLVNFYFFPGQAFSAGVRVWIRGLVVVMYLITVPRSGRSHFILGRSDFTVARALE